MLPPFDEDDYWNSVKSALRAFDVPHRDALTRLRNTILTLTSAQQELFYHLDPFEVALDLTGAAGWSSEVVRAHDRFARSVGRPGERRSIGRKSDYDFSLALLAVVQRNTSPDERKRATSELLRLRVGFWHTPNTPPETLSDFLLRLAREKMQRAGAEPRQHDVEELAAQVMARLFERKTRLANPVRWLKRQISERFDETLGEGDASIRDLLRRFSDQREVAGSHARLLHIREALSRLPLDMRDALLMQAAGYSADQIGGALSIPSEAVRPFLQRARHALREELYRVR